MQSLQGKQTELEAMSEQWYAMQSKPRCEHAAYEQARTLGFEVYYPAVKVRTVNPRARQVQPFFPGYLFLKADLELTGVSVFQWMRYSNGLVSFDGKPAPIPEALVHGIRTTLMQRIESGKGIWDELEPGDGVSIVAGPFAGYEAIFNSRLPGSERVRLLLELVHGQTITLTLNSTSIKSTKRR